MSLQHFFGALLGDQAGFGIGRTTGGMLTDWLRRSPARTKLLAQAEGFMVQRGALAVFLSRWLFSPLGPYVNLLTGAAGMRWRIFTLMSAAGEVIWVAAYVGLGFLFYENLGSLAAILSDSVRPRDLRHDHAAHGMHCCGDAHRVKGNRGCPFGLEPTRTSKQKPE